MINRISVEYDYFETINTRERENKLSTLDFLVLSIVYRNEFFHEYYQHTFKSFVTLFFSFWQFSIQDEEKKGWPGDFLFLSKEYIAV